MMEPVLNELSLEPAERPTLERMTALAKVVQKLAALGLPRILRHGRDVLHRDVEANMSFRTWLFQEAPRDLKGLLGSYLLKAPFVEELHQQQESTSRALLQASHLGVPAAGAGAAHLLNAPAVALGGVPRWEIDPLEILLGRMSEDDDGTLEEMVVEVIHLCLPEQVDARAALLRERILRAVSGGNDLWRRKNELFPRLDFCDSVERQICGLSGNEFYFQRVVEALARLDASLAVWTSGPLHPGMEHSPESQATLTHGSYGPMRDFVCPDRQTRRFKNHLKLFSNNWRIYYWETRLAEDGGRAFVGYVGVHLPTVKHRT